MIVIMEEWKGAIITYIRAAEFAVVLSLDAAGGISFSQIFRLGYSNQIKIVLSVF